MSDNTHISVTAVSFTDQFEAVPRRIELEGVSYDLETPRKHLILRSDEGVTSTFDVSDGTYLFRLRHSLLEWRLISMSSINT